jgi:hypothetical protein
MIPRIWWLNSSADYSLGVVSATQPLLEYNQARLGGEIGRRVADVQLSFNMG